MGHDHDEPDRTTQLAWKAASMGAAVLGSIVVRRVLAAVWQSVGAGDEEPPLNPADRRISWSSALQWAIAAGIGAGLGRLVSQRLAAAGWEAVTGSPPPGIRPAD